MSPKKKSKGDDDLQFLKAVVDNRKVSKREIENYANINYPLFSFRWLNEDFHKDCDNAKFFKSFLNRLYKLSELGWNEIRTSDRHSFGMEPIPVKEFKVKKLPIIVTPDVKDLHVFRATGDNHPMIGLQEGKIFHIFFIETEWNAIYDHD